MHELPTRIMLFDVEKACIADTIAKTIKYHAVFIKGFNGVR
jgi:hypothetical protein